MQSIHLGQCQSKDRLSVNKFSSVNLSTQKPLYCLREFRLRRKYVQIVMSID